MVGKDKKSPGRNTGALTFLKGAIVMCDKCILSSVCKYSDELEGEYRNIINISEKMAHVEITSMGCRNVHAIAYKTGLSIERFIKEDNSHAR